MTDYTALAAGAGAAAAVLADDPNLGVDATHYQAGISVGVPWRLPCRRQTEASVGSLRLGAGL